MRDSPHSIAFGKKVGLVAVLCKGFIAVSLDQGILNSFYRLLFVVCCFIRPLEMLWMKTVFFLRREESFCSLHLIQFTISTAHSYPSSNSEWTCGKIMSSLVLQKWVKLLQFERLCPKLSRKCTMFCEVFWFNCCCQLVCSIVRISCVWVLHWYGYGKKIPLSIQLWYTI